MGLFPSARGVAAVGAVLACGALVLGIVAVPVGATSSTIPKAPKSAKLAAEVPKAIRSRGVLTFAMDATYPPEEFVAANGHTIVGADADFATAIGQVLGIKVKLINATFSTIIPGLLAGKYDIGLSSFTDTKAREKQLSFVDYYKAGEGFYVLHNSNIVVHGLKGLCGHSVSVETGTTEQSDAQATAKTCKVTVDSFSTQTAANLAVSSGRAQIGFADSEVAAYIVATSHGVFKNSGSAIKFAPYGIALPKHTGIVAPILGAVNALLSDGIYMKILDKWFIPIGAIPKAVLNGATS
jgi:polar amino acid transport system substrate-binding protein